MKTLLFLNGPEGCQMGIEDGFQHLKKTKHIDELFWFYYLDYAKKYDCNIAQKNMVDIAIKFQPQLIVFFHIGNFPVNDKFFTSFKKLPSKPLLVYDEGDIYGGWSKPITRSMKCAFKNVDAVSVRGLGKWYDKISKLNNSVIYTPHSNSLFRYTQNTELKKERSKNVVFAGNRVRSKLGKIRRLHGANDRESVVKYISKYLDNEFELFGKGWNNIPGNRGILDFFKQVEVFHKNWFHLSVEHFPEIPYYFSDRLPIALSSGQIFICHFHEGYQNIFNKSDFIYFFNNKIQAIDIIYYLKSLNYEQLFQKSQNAKKWADENLSPIIVWSNFYKKLQSKYSPS